MEATVDGTLASEIVGFRIAPQQERLWRLAGARAGSYRARLAIEVRDPRGVDPAAVRAALTAVLERHESLRARFESLPGMTVPVQVIEDAPQLAWQTPDTPLQEAPGVRATFTVLEPDRALLAIDLPALCADEASLFVIARDLFRTWSEDEAAVPYTQFAEWQSQVVEDFLAESGGEPHPLAALAAERVDLPFARRRGAAPFEPRAVTVDLPEDMAGRLAALAGRLGVDRDAVLLAAWAALAARVCDGRPVVAERFHGREHELLADAVGLFAKWLPLAGPDGPETPWSDLVAGLAAAREAARQDAAAFVWDAAQGHPEIGFSASAPAASIRTGTGAELRVVSAESADDAFAVLLRARSGGGGLALDLLYDAGRVDEADAGRLAGKLLAVFEAVLADPGIPVGRIDLLTAAERRALVDEANATFAELPAEPWVHRRFERAAAAHPDRTAVACGGASLTYGELARRSSRLARHLLRLGVGADVPVALYAERSVELVVGLLGILKAGGAYVPVEPGQPRQRLASILSDVAAPVIVTRKAVRSTLPPFAGAVVDLDDPALEAESADDPGLPVHGEQLVYVLFTSGSTGRPKGVAVEHRQLASYTAGVTGRLDLPAEGRYLIVSTFAADLGNTVVFPALCQGATLEIVPAECASDAEAMAELAARTPVDVLKIVPSHLQALHAANTAGSRPFLPARRLVLGGEASPPGWIEELRERAGGCRIFNHYGPSETTVGVLTHEVDGPVDPRAATLPLGRPLPNDRVYLLDHDGRPVPRWTPGEVWIGGAQVARGYAGRPDLTAERFLPDPFSGEPGTRLYRTGDLARFLGDGTVEFLGRADHQIKYHGFRVELEEIRALLRRHPQVRDAVARVLRDDQGRDVLAAYYVSRQPVDTAELRALLSEYLLAETLPNVYIHLRRMPLTLNGKVDLAGLPGLDAIRQLDRGAFVAPRTPVEQILAGLWTEVLGVERVSAHDSFFELGGHSLLATRLASRVRQTFGVELPLRSLFDAPALAGFAERVEAALRSGSKTEVPPLAPAPRDRPLPPSFAQERLWLMHQLDPESPAYNMPGALGFRGPLSAAALGAALGEVVRRHEVLRTRFAEQDGLPVQVVDPPRGWLLPVIDLSGLETAPREAREAEIRRLAEAEARRPFDLAAGPVLRTALLRREARDHVLLITLHHVVGDAWSIDVFVRELTAFYAGRSTSLPPLALQYADFAAWQRSWLSGATLEAEIEHWRRQLAGAPERIELPLDRPRPQVASFRGAVHDEPIAAEVWQGIEALARKEKATPFMVLLAAFATLLHRTTGAVDLPVGTDVANRNHLALEGMVGFFVNNLVLRTDLSGDPTFQELVARVRETTLQAYAHQDLPFDRLVKALAPKRHLSTTPLFQVLFVLQNAPAWELALPGIEVERLDFGVETAKFDLALFLRPATGGAWTANWSYRPDLFDAATVARFGGRYSTLLSSLLARPEARLSELEMVTAMETQAQEESSLGRLRGARRRTAEPAVSDLVEMEPLVPGQALPLVVRPRSRDHDLVGWAASQRDLLEAKLRVHGGLLFRGFQIGGQIGGQAGGIGEFERFAAAIAPDLYGEYGDLPREQEGEKVYHSTPYPEDKSILFHNESSHMHRWPLKQWFYCVTPAPVGGATPLLDCRRSYRALRPELAAELEAKGLIYVRNFSDGLDVSWQAFFRTSDRAAVEAWCAQAGMEHSWKDDGLETRQRALAVAVHPKTGEKVLFNQIQLHHPACLDPETRTSLRAAFGDESNLPRNVLFGDGTPIPDEVVEEIGRLYEELAVRFTWEQGDVVMLDNMLTAHARDPYSGPRKIVVAMGEITTAAQLAG